MADRPQLQGWLRRPRLDRGRRARERQNRQCHDGGRVLGIRARAADAALVQPARPLGTCALAPEGRAAARRKGAMIAKAVYICTQCNQLVPDPVKGKCPRGHLLRDRDLFFATSELSFGASFLKTLGVCIAVFLATTAVLALLKKP